jgi:putative ABC transport system substrate-binding protein
LLQTTLGHELKSSVLVSHAFTGLGSKHLEADLEAAFGIMVERRADALLVIADPFFIARREHVVALAAGHAIPAIYPTRWFPECGGLMSYGSALGSLYQQVGSYAGRVEYPHILSVLPI